MSELCLFCEKGILSTKIVDEDIQFNGSTISVTGIEISECDFCHEQMVLPSQSKKNDVRFADAKRIESGLLTSAQIKHCRELAGLNQAQAATVFGGGINAFSKYERGEVFQSRQMDMLLRLSMELPIARDWMLNAASIDAPWKSMPSEAGVTDFAAAVKRMRTPSKSGTASMQPFVIEADEDLEWHDLVASGR